MNYECNPCTSHAQQLSHEPANPLHPGKKSPESKANDKHE